jgi:gliding motility-associated-like protein
VSIAVVEKRSGVIINKHRKDLHVKVANCLETAELPAELTICNGLTISPDNKLSVGKEVSYYWDFGVSGTNSDTSIEQSPTFSFPDTGSYRIMLVTNRNLHCSDTAYSVARVYPLTANFSPLSGCANAPVSFKDETAINSGNVNGWRWNFGDPLSNTDTSTRKEPVYSYPKNGSYNVELVVTNSAGCRDTVRQVVNISDKPEFQLTNDTLICSLDTIKLSARGSGSFSWSPNSTISDTTAAEPLVSPDEPITYYVRFVSSPGCENIDSVFVDVRRSVTVNLGNDTTICLSDPVQLNPATDGLSFNWSPASTLSETDIRNPLATPDATTTYRLTARIGKCEASDEITIQTVPYPVAMAGTDTTICFGASVQLSASGGTAYRWTPATGLNAGDIPDPIAQPATTTSYVVAVTDDKGCPKEATDTVQMVVIPPLRVNAGRDTTIILGQSLQLNASGGDRYSWSPSTGLNDPGIPNPVATLNSDITYVLSASTENGCSGKDTIRIKVFESQPDIYVPTAFTPNNDGKNDQLVPIPVGITQFDFFKVYNYYGEMVFSTTQSGKGWDGRINGKEQSGTVVWYVQGIDLTGRKIFKKGTATIIR